MVTLENTGLCWKQHKTQNTTHTDTATTKMSHATLPIIFIFHFLLVWVDRCLIIFIFQHMKYGDIHEHWPKKTKTVPFFSCRIFSGHNLIDEEICQKTKIHYFHFSKYEIWWHSRTLDCFGGSTKHKTQHTQTQQPQRWAMPPYP